MSKILVLDEQTNRTNRLVRISESSVDSLDEVEEGLDEEQPRDYKVFSHSRVITRYFPAHV